MLPRHLLLLAIGLILSCQETSGRPPNIILMLADDVGYGDLSCYGSKLNRTPVLDALAAQGIRLTDCHAGAPVCTPSRMALLSGYYPRRLGWPGGVLGHRMEMQGGMASEVRTLAELFKDAGYRTAMIGKWHLGDHAERLPLGQGFDEAYYIKSSNNQTKELWRDGRLEMNPFDNRRLTEQFTDEAIAFIRRNRDKPFLIYLPFTAAHFPVQAHPDWAGHSNNGEYGDVIEELDARIGKLMETLDQLAIRGDTLVVFTSDNGPENKTKGITTAEPWRGRKWDSLEGGTRVPCILNWPGMIPAGRVHDGLTAFIDLLPTLARAGGISAAAAPGAPPLDGLDQWAAITGKDGSGQRHELLMWDGWATPHAIRRDQWKLFFSGTGLVAESDQGPVLFDLGKDMTESRNVAKDHPELVNSMLERARSLVKDIDGNHIPIASEADRAVVPPPARWLTPVQP